MYKVLKQTYDAIRDIQILSPDLLNEKNEINFSSFLNRHFK